MSTGLNSWATRSLQNLTALIKDGSHGTHQDTADGIPLLSAKDVRDGILDIPENCRRISERDYALIHKNYSIEKGDILLTIVGTIGRCCRITGSEPRFTIQRSVGVIRSNTIDPDYLYQYFRAEFFQRDLKDSTTASAQGGVYLGSLAKCSVTYPTSSEHQAKIAEILSTVDRAIEQTEALIAKHQRIKTGLMQDLLTRGMDEHGNLRAERTHKFKDTPLGRIPEEWEVETLGRVIGAIISGWSPTCETVSASEDEWAILKTTAVVWAGYTPGENKRLPSGLRGVPSIEVHPDDILITRKGPVERVGVVVHVKETRPRLMIPDTVFKMRLLDGSQVAPAFLPLALQSASVQSDWFQKKIGLADAQVNLNHSIIRATLFPKPKPREQEVIVAIAEKIRRDIYVDLSRLSKLRSLKTALMQDLLTGKKRVTPLLELEPKREKIYARH